MGSSTQTSTSTSGPSNKDLNATISKLSKGIADAYIPGTSAYVAPSATTTGGRQASLDAAGNPAFATGIQGALGSYANRAAGNELGLDDPLYAAQRTRLIDDVTRSTNASFNNSGLFGSDSNQRALGEGLANGLGSLDMQQRNESRGLQSEAALMLPQLFSGQQLPASIQQSVGASMDADARAQKNGQIDYLNQFTNVIGGAAGASGTTTTNTTPTTPLWQTLLGGGIGLMGLL